MDYYSKDLTVIERAEHDINALSSDLENLSSDALEIDFIRSKITGLKQACEDLRAAIGYRRNEKQETVQARRDTEEALTQAIRFYVGMRQEAAPYVSELRRDELTAAEFGQREFTFASVFPVAGSDFSRFGRGVQVEKLTLAAQALSADSPAVKPLAELLPVAQFTKLVEELRQHNQRLDRETAEDQQATTKANEARAELEKRTRIYNFTVRAFCIEHGLESRLSQYLSAHDSKAPGRRAAGAKQDDTEAAEESSSETPEA